MVDMRHLEFLETVRAFDVATLRDKEATYQGSWKAAGGRSAWFMMRRNMDRLMVMMAPPPRPEGFSVHGMLRDGSKDGTVDGDITYLRKSYTAEDIFAKIEEKPAGEDGTVLACVRDLRCYLTLIEAEMMARGVVVPDIMVNDVVAIKGDLRDFTDRQIANMIHGRNKDDDGEFTASSMGAAQEEKEFAPGDLCWYQEGDHVVAVKSRFISLDPDYPGIAVVTMVNGDGSRIKVKVGHLKRVHGGPRSRSTYRNPRNVPMDQGYVNPEGDKGVTVHRTFAEDEIRPATPEDGGHHASLFPWSMPHDVMLTFLQKHTTTVQETISQFYKRRTNDLHILEEVVDRSFTTDPTRFVPGMIRACYDRHMTQSGLQYVIRIRDIPADCRAFYPVLHVELNHKQFEELPCWQKSLYKWSDTHEKFLMHEAMLEWSVGVKN